MDTSSKPNSESETAASAAARKGMRDLTAALVGSEQLQELKAINMLQQALSEQLTEAVLEARRQGLTWVQIGQLLGVTEQAAHQRFAEIERGGTEGMSAAEAARQRRVNRSTIQRNPGRYGFERIPSESPGSPRYRPVE